MVSLLRLLANNMALLTLAAATLAFFVPAAFTIFEYVFKELFAATMFALGVVLNADELLLTLKKPVRIFLGVLTQFVVMPLLAYAIVTLAGLPPALALGFIIVGSAPGAMASNVIVYLAGGALAFSISLTTVATFLAPFLTPFLVAQLGGQYIAIDPWKMMWTIVYILVIPLAGGMLSRHFLQHGFQRRFTTLSVLLGSLVLFILSQAASFNHWQLGLCGLFLLVFPALAMLVPHRQRTASLHWAREFAPAMAALAIIIICAFAVAQNQAQIRLVGGLVLVLVILLNALGYLAGWYLAKLYRFDHNHRITLAIEIGMQNAGMGVALALAHFRDQPEVALPGALFAVWCILTAAGASAYFRRRTALVKA
jgi:BASS family bile acid:Na+ symporter